VSMKENFNKAVEWGKKNPIIVLLLFIGIVWLLMRTPAAHPAETPLPALPNRITGQTFPQIGGGARQALHVPNRITEQTFPQVGGGARPAPHVPTKPEEYVETPEPVNIQPPGTPVFLPAAGGRGVLDYHVVGPRVYQERIAAAHAAWVPGFPDRITDVAGRILTAERGFETPRAVIERQEIRFDRAMARGDLANADMVRRETELATGIRTGW